MAVLTDGHPTYVNLAPNGGAWLNDVAGVLYKEHTVTPPGLDSNGINDTTSMRNVLFRSRQPKHLVTMTEFKMNVFYDSKMYDITSAFWKTLRILSRCAAQFPDGSAIVFWGWLDKMNPQDIKEGESPMAEANIVCSNQAYGDAALAQPINGVFDWFGKAVRGVMSINAGLYGTPRKNSQLYEVFPNYYAPGDLPAGIF